MIGSTTVMAATAIVHLFVKLSAIFINISGRAPVVRRHQTMLITMGGKTFEASNGQ
jgi:hypothetical protein